MKMEFNPDGTVKVPEIKKEKQKPLLKNAKKIILKYCGAEHDKLIECEWEILPGEGVVVRDIFKVKERTDKVVDLHRPAQIYIKKTNTDYPPEYSLIIRGRGHDERCTWCRSFRTALQTYFYNQKVAVEEQGGCSFI